MQLKRYQEVMTSLSKRDLSGGATGADSDTAEAEAVQVHALRCAIRRSENYDAASLAAYLVLSALCFQTSRHQA